MVVFSLTVGLLAGSFIGLSLGYGWVWGRVAIARRHSPYPQALLVLGGNPQRERFAAQFASQHPGLEIWFSSGMATAEILALFESTGIDPAQLHFDRRAVDTVTNFTTLVGDFQHLRLRHLYLMTSDYHMPRSQAIAFWVFGSRGIAMTPVAVPSRRPPEASWRILRDQGRSLLWILTGRTAAGLRRWLKVRRSRLRKKPV